MNCLPVCNDWAAMRNLIPVCGSVICQAPGVIYVSIDPDVFKIRCRQCQEKTEHRCPLPKLKRRFRAGGGGGGGGGGGAGGGGGRGGAGGGGLGREILSKKFGNNFRQLGKENELEEEESEDLKNAKMQMEMEEMEEEGRDEEEDEEENENKQKVIIASKPKNDQKSDKNQKPGPTAPKFVPIAPEPVAIPDHYCTCTATPKEICDCEVYKPLNFMFELEVTGEFKPAYVPKAKKGKYQ